MDSLTESLSVYRELADRYDQLGQVSMRDRFLMLAADAALEAGQAPEAERLRDRLLQTSRHHMLRPYRSFAEAVQAPDVQTYLRDLRANYPLDIARQLLDSLRPSSGPALDQTQPTNWSPLDAIPPTAPLGNQNRTAWKPASPQPIADEPAPAPAYRPLGQPLAGRAPVAQPAPVPRTSVEPGPTRAPVPATVLAPTRNVPLPTSRPAGPSSPGSMPQPATPAAAPEPSQEAGGAWLNYALTGIVLLAGVLLAVFALARPFLPSGWLP